MPKLLLLSLPLFMLAMSCASAPGRLSGAAATPANPHVHLLHVPGIGGVKSEDEEMLSALRHGGFNGSLEMYDWTGGEAPVPAYFDRQRQLTEPRSLAATITAMRKTNPRDQIILTAHSAGAAIVVSALEQMPADVQVDNVVLMAPALSPHYDLRLALAHVRDRMIVLCSQRDLLVLGVATTIFGTIDGSHSNAAGLIGFEEPRGAEGEYQKLAQLPYQTAWWNLGDDGGHTGAQAPAFVSAVLAPLLKSSAAQRGPLASTVAIPPVER
jgi:pimeloyl-ACP methyl ester carboxylesterase